MDATCVAGGISGQVLFFGVGASQIAYDFRRSLRRRIKNPASYAGWTRHILINLGMKLKIIIIYTFQENLQLKCCLLHSYGNWKISINEFDSKFSITRVIPVL